MCVRWTLGANWGEDAGKTMGTSVTHGTRRESDVAHVAGLQIGRSY